MPDVRTFLRPASFFDLVILSEAASRAEGSHWLAAAKHRDQILRRRRSTRRGLREATSRFAHKRRGRSFSPPKLRFGGGPGKATSLRMTGFRLCRIRRAASDDMTSPAPAGPPLLPGEARGSTQKKGTPSKRMLRWGKERQARGCTLAFHAKVLKARLKAPQKGDPMEANASMGRRSDPGSSTENHLQKGDPIEANASRGKGAPGARLRFGVSRQSAESTPQSAPKRGPHGSIRFHGEKERARHS